MARALTRTRAAAGRVRAADRGRGGGGSQARQFFEHSQDAGPDQTFFAVGSGFTSELYTWGMSAKSNTGQSWPLKVQLSKEGYVSATLPDRCYDGPMLVWAKNVAGWSRPIRLNTPQAWFCWPLSAAPGEDIQVIGRNLSPRPEGEAARVYLCQAGKAGRWLDSLGSRYHLVVRLPHELESGEYQLWVHAGRGGSFGWSEPLKVIVKPFVAPPERTITLEKCQDNDHLQRELDKLAAQGGGTLELKAGEFPFRGTLRIGANVGLAGDTTPGSTRVVLVHDTAAQFKSPSNVGWNRGVTSIHTVGDTIEYAIDLPADGPYTLWTRYATEMKAYKMDGVSKNMSVQIDDGPSIPMDNLPNTGSFGTYRWSKSAIIDAKAGKHTLHWRNDKGGGITLDAFVLVRDPAKVISDTPPPENGDGVLIIQAENPSKFKSKDGQLPGGDAPVVWLSDHGAAIRNLTLSGGPQTNIGILIGHTDPLKPVENCDVVRVRVINVEGKFGENSGVRVANAIGASIRDCTLTARTPIFLAGAYRCEISGNTLESVTRYGGNSEAAILSRCERLEECLIDFNRFVSTEGALSGGPTARRMIWFSTGRGSVVHNRIAHNGIGHTNDAGKDIAAGTPRFGGVAGTDQNVGEMILFEGNHRTMYFGKPVSADATSVTLPKTIPATPDNRLGSVKREQLAHDAAGNETPFWPPDDFDSTQEPPIHQYCVTICAGAGQGQTRRVVRREGEKLILEKPWNHTPDASSTIAVGTAFYQNVIESNYTPDGMTGVQLWISCMENIVSGNTIARQRKPGVFLYAAGSTLASSMPRTWNRGIAPLFFNHVEGNRAEECSVGGYLSSGDAKDLPVEFPLALGNVLRHNSFIKSRADGVLLQGRGPVAGQAGTVAAILGTVVEFNVVRDALVGYHASAGADGTVIRRNHAYFWYPVASTTQPTVGIQLDNPDGAASVELNSIEGKHGTGEKATVELKKGNQ
ncbi:MAG: hypothetical protein QM813_06015 [Verrucomicrobiota bacterium]